MDRHVIILNSVLNQLKIKAKVASFKEEGTFLVFDLELSPGGKFKQIENATTEIALALHAISVPLIYPIMNEGIIRMEVMIREPSFVNFKDVYKDVSGQIIPLALGKKHNGESLIADLVEMPHLLISGATGSGKSIMLHSIINTVLNNPNIKLCLIDPKRVEFSNYSGIRSLYSPIARDIVDIRSLLGDMIEVMESRFKLLEKKNKRNISEYKGNMSYIVVVIDELSSMMSFDKKNFQELICKLAQKSRACGIHIVAATQRPSVDIVTGLIKANFPGRISCRVSSQADSRTILNCAGAEKLLGNGDAIIDCEEYSFVRFKGSFLSNTDIVQNTSKQKKWWWQL